MIAFSNICFFLKLKFLQDFDFFIELGALEFLQAYVLLKSYCQDLVSLE